MTTMTTPKDPPPWPQTSLDVPHSSSVHFLDPVPKPSIESIKSEPPDKARQQHESLSRSPSLPPRHPRVQSEIIKPRRTSLVTGGYQSSDSESPIPRRKPFESPRKMSRKAPARIREITSSPDSRKGKERANGLAQSLGLDSAREGLTSDQINNLLNDTDVVSALRMMNNTNLAARLSASRQPQEVYIARAPPPLVQAETRDRAVSNASTIGPPAEWHAAVARRASRSEPQGHIPFTHPIAIEEDTVTEEDHSVGVSTPKRKRPHRLSNLFHLKRNVSQDEEVQSLASSKDERDEEMKRVEAQRREEEVMQERRFKALTQVAAHPESERLAYRASSHLRNYYNLVFEGLENPPRLNPLAVIRWKQKTEEQADLQAHWEGKIVTPPTHPGWHYTMDEVVQYRDVKGVVNYFVPPRATFRDSGESSRNAALESKVSLGSGLTSKGSVMSSEPQAPPLSRALSTASSDKRQRHRHHQSLGAIAPERLANALRHPFVKHREHEESLRAKSLTDDEHQFHLRNLISRAFDARKSPDLEKDRHVELQALQSALAKETALRQRQNETERRSKLEREAQDRMHQLQSEIYGEKRIRLAETKRRLDLLDRSIETTEDALRQYTFLSDQISDISLKSFGITATFPDLARIKGVYYTSATMRSVSTTGHQSMFAYGVNPFPKRTEALERVERALEQAKEAQTAMHGERRDTEAQLRAMINRIDALMKQKDAVRAWTKSALEANRILRLTMESLNAEVIGNNRARFLRARDQMIDFGLRQGVGQLFKMFYKLWYVIIWSWSWRTRSARQNLREEQKGWRGVPWGTSLFIMTVAAVLLFYHLGD